MTKNAPVILDTVTKFDPVSSICDVIKEHQRLKTVRAELEHDARKHEEDMATERKRIDFAMAELDNDFRKHKTSMDFAREQLDAQVRLAEKQLQANERKFRALLEDSDKMIARGTANQAQIRNTMETMTNLLKDNTLGAELRGELGKNLLGMADKLNQSQAQLEESHSRSLLAIQDMDKTLQLGDGA